MPSSTPLCRCRVLYIGCAVPTITKDGLQGIQEPLRERYPVDSSVRTKGLDAWLSIWSNGLLLEFPEKGSNDGSTGSGADDAGSETGRAKKEQSAFHPIESLHYCAAVRYVNVAGLSIGGNAPGGGPAVTDRFLPLDSQFANLPNSPHPPIFAAMVRRTSGVRVLECHAFICTSPKAANALVRCCFHAYADSMYLKVSGITPGQLALPAPPAQKASGSSRGSSPRRNGRGLPGAGGFSGADDSDDEDREVVAQWSERTRGKSGWERRQQAGEYDSYSISSSLADRYAVKKGTASDMGVMTTSKVKRTGKAATDAGSMDHSQALVPYDPYHSQQPFLGPSPLYGTYAPGRYAASDYGGGTYGTMTEMRYGSMMGPPPPGSMMIPYRGPMPGQPIYGTMPPRPPPFMMMGPRGPMPGPYGPPGPPSMVGGMRPPGPPMGPPGGPRSGPGSVISEGRAAINGRVKGGSPPPPPPQPPGGPPRMMMGPGGPGPFPGGPPMRLGPPPMMMHPDAARGPMFMPQRFPGRSMSPPPGMMMMGGRPPMMGGPPGPPMGGPPFGGPESTIYGTLPRRAWEEPPLMPGSRGPPGSMIGGPRMMMGGPPPPPASYTPGNFAPEYYQAYYDAYIRGQDGNGRGDYVEEDEPEDRGRRGKGKGASGKTEKRSKSGGAKTSGGGSKLANGLTSPGKRSAIETDEYDDYDDDEDRGSSYLFHEGGIHRKPYLNEKAFGSSLVSSPSPSKQQQHRSENLSINVSQGQQRGGYVEQDPSPDYDDSPPRGKHRRNRSISNERQLVGDFQELRMPSSTQRYTAQPPLAGQIY